MKSSVVDFYLQKQIAPEGDNIVPNLTKSPIHLSRAGRPLRTCSTSALKHADGDFMDSDYESDFMKSPVRKPNLSKPKASGPSASRVASQKKRSGIPKTSVPSSV